MGRLGQEVSGPLLQDALSVGCEGALGVALREGEGELAEPGQRPASTGKAARPRVSGDGPTSWALITRAQSTDPARRREALGELIERYRPTVLTLYRRLRRPPDLTAEELTQQFFFEVLARNDIDKLDQARGRFRGWLHRAAKSCFYNAWDKWRRLKDGRRLTDSLSDGRRLRHGDEDAGAAQAPIDFDSVDRRTPEHYFLCSFAEETERHARARFFAEHRDHPDLPRFERLLLPGPDFVPEDNTEYRALYAQLAADHGITVSHARVKVCKLRELYRQCLRHAVADTLDLDPDDPQWLDKVDREMALMWRAIAAIRQSANPWHAPA